MVLFLLIVRTILTAQIGQAPIVQQLTVAAPATTQPTTQPVTVVVQTTPGAQQPESLVEGVTNTRLAQIIEGKQKLEWKDVTQPVFWVDTIRNLVDTLLEFVPRLIGTLIFLVVFWLAYRGIRRALIGNMKKSDVDSSIRDMISALIKWVVMGFGVVIACNQLGIPIVAMLTGVSIIGLAVGFAAQETLANFIAGIVIFLDKPFKVNDWLTIDSTFCQVKRVTFRSSRLLTKDGEYVVFPNTHMLSDKIVNHSHHPLNRINVEVSISYRSSLADARKVLLELCNGDSRLAVNPAPEVVVTELAASSVNLKLRFWIEDESIEQAILYEYLEKAKTALDAAAVEMPFPHLQLFLEETAAVKLLAKAG
jgi:small conductance mechanosensitive channel